MPVPVSARRAHVLCCSGLFKRSKGLLLPSIPSLACQKVGIARGKAICLYYAVCSNERHDRQTRALVGQERPGPADLQLARQGLQLTALCIASSSELGGTAASGHCTFPKRPRHTRRICCSVGGEIGRRRRQIHRNYSGQVRPVVFPSIGLLAESLDLSAFPLIASFASFPLLFHLILYKDTSALDSIPHAQYQCQYSANGSR